MGNLNNFGTFFSLILSVTCVLALITSETDMELAKLNERLMAISGKIDTATRTYTTRIESQMRELRNRTEQIEKTLTHLHALINEQTSSTARKIDILNEQLTRHLDAKLETILTAIERRTTKEPEVTDRDDSGIGAPMELVLSGIRNSSTTTDLIHILNVVTADPHDPTSAPIPPDNDPRREDRRNRTDTQSTTRLLRQLWRQFLKPILQVGNGVDKLERLVQRGDIRGQRSARQLDGVEKRMNELVERVTAPGSADWCSSLTRTMESAGRRVDGQFDHLEQRLLYQSSLAEKIYDRLREANVAYSPEGGDGGGAVVTAASDDVGEVPGSDCRDIQRRGATESGVYVVGVDGKRLNVFCDMETMGGGWMTVQRRDQYPGEQENFSRSWQDYKIGFGDIQREFWLGNDNLHSMTSRQDYSLLVQLRDFDGISVYAIYAKFRVSSEDDLFRLQVSGYSGNASDSLSAHDSKPFSTYDRTHDEVDPCCSCAPTFGGGWWFYACFEAHLNGPYRPNPTDNGYYGGIIWEHWRGDYSLRYAAMHIRPTAAGGASATTTTDSRPAPTESEETEVEDP